MTKTPSPTYTAMLDHAGFADEDALYSAATAAAADPARSAVMQHLLGAFNDLESAERALRGELDAATTAIERVQGTLDRGLRLDVSWIGHHADRVRGYGDQVQAAIGQIQAFSRIRHALPAAETHAPLSPDSIHTPRDPHRRF